MADDTPSFYKTQLGVVELGAPDVRVQDPATGKEWAGDYPMPVSSGGLISPYVPDVRPAAGSITARDVGSSTTTGQNGQIITTGTPTANSYQSDAINGLAGVRVQISNVWTGTLTFQGSVDVGVTWETLYAYVDGTNFRQTGVTGNGDFYAVVAGLTNFRVVSTAAMTGTATVRRTYTAESGAVHVISPINLVDNATGSMLSIVNGAATVQGAETAGAAVTGGGVRIMGSDGTNARDIKTDASGNQLVLGTGAAGTPSAGVLSIQGVASMTPVDTNLTKVAGAAVAVGHGVAATALRVELPTDGTGVVGLNAGTNIIGKVAIDQTTPGTTNAVAGSSTAADGGALTLALKTWAISATYNGSTVDLSRSAANGTNSTGTGIAAVGLVGHYDDTSPQTVTENQFGNLRMTSTGELAIAGQVSGGTTTKALLTEANGYLGVFFSASTYANITTATTTLVKNGAGTLESLVINTYVAAATITIYDNTAGSGTTIGKITLPAAGAGDIPISLDYGCSFGTGLTIVTSGATDITVIFR